MKRAGTRINRLSNALYYNNARNLIVQSFVDNGFYINKNGNLKKPIKIFRLPRHHTLVKINPSARLIYDECDIFDFKGKEIDHKIPCGSFYVKSVVFSKDGKKVYLLGAERFSESKKSFIKTYSVKRWKEIAHVDIKIKRSELNDLWVSNDGVLAYVSTYERGKVEVLDLDKSRWLRDLSHMGIIEQIEMIGSERAWSLRSY